MSMIKELMEMHANLDEDLFANVYAHIKGRLRHGSVNIEDAINDFLDEDGTKLDMDQLRALNHAVRERLHGDRMRVSQAVQK